MKELSERKKMYFFQPIPYIHYIPPKLTEGKEWYISYSVINPETGKFKRFRIKCNRVSNLKERRKIAKEIVAKLSQRLIAGWSPFIEKHAPNASDKLFETLDTFLKIKGKETEANSMRSYNSYIKIFKTWLKAHRIDENSPNYVFSKDMAITFMNEIEQNVSPKTYNNYLNFFRSLFNWMVAKRYIESNPFSEIVKKAKRLTKKTRKLLNDEELLRLFTYLQENNPEYLAMCILCYCCFMRPKEIALLKCRDIDLKKQTVHVSAVIAKNDNDSYRTIPDDVMPVFRKLDLSDKSLYLFSQHTNYNFKPGKIKICSRKIAKYWSDIIRSKCRFPMELQFYSLKDTGITNMLSEGIPITFVQQQADHSSVAMTAIYVGKRNNVNEQLKKAELIPKI